MRIFQVIMMTLAVLVGVSVAQAQAQAKGAFGGGVPHIAARLEAESASPAPGGSTTIAFAMTPEAGWHGYWENPGDAGLGMTVEWTLPRGVTVGPLRYPVPETLLISGLMNHVYEGRYGVLATLNVASDVKPGTRLPVRVKAQWLACTDKVCVPESGEMTLDLVAGKGQASAADRVRFDAWRTHQPRPLGSEATYAIANGTLRLSVPFPADAQASDVHLFPLAEGLTRYAAPQTVTREGDRLVVMTQAGEGGKVGPVQAVLRTGDHVGFLLTARPGAVAAPAGADGQAGAILAALGGALLGGLLLNIMPCVFPILGLKVMKLAKAGGDERIVRREALAYAAGVIMTCLVLGGLLLALRAAGTAAGWAFQLQDPRIILALLLLVTGIAFNLAGLFELGAVGGGDRLAGKGGMTGAFWTGALVAFVATPCTGPFMAAAMGAALLLPLAAALAVFAGLGLGLALPFLLLAFVPALRRMLPRPGAWMGRLQKILAIPMFLTALGLAWLLGQQRGVAGMTIGLAAALAIALLLWWLGARQRAGRGGAVAAAVAGLALLAGAVVILPSSTPAAAASTDHLPFDEARLASLRAANKPVFLYFTADWCLTCKANEAAAIDRAETRAAFAQGGVAVMVGDWTNVDPAITRFLEAQGRSGVPLYLWYAPGRDAQTLPQLLTPGTLTGLVR